MMWLTWRLQRSETLIAGAVMGLIAIFLLATGLNMASVFRGTGLAACLAHDPAPNACQGLDTAFVQRFAAVTNVITWLNFVPLVLGILVSAPFVLDLEQGTYRLAWVQSITRRRWLAVKVADIVAAAVLAGVVLMVLMTWWNGPLDELRSRLNRDQFDFEGTAPVAYTVFAAALCLAAGSLFRRTVPAIGITLAGYLAGRIGMETFVGYSYLAPVTKHVTFSAAGDPNPPTRADYFIRSTASIPKDVMRACFGGTLDPPPPGSAAAKQVGACFGRHGVFASVIYQPGSRFWLFQGVESAVFLIPAIALLALTIWLVRYRLR
jgi:hypothetical protein